MRRSGYHALINRGRKAGLRTVELYNALAARRPEESDASDGRTDGNGFVATFDHQGQRVYRPSGTQARS
jgi:hypothetical protein